jgi:hypothetical protein
MVHAIVLSLLVLAGQASADDLKWKQVALEGSGVEVSMPGEPKVTSKIVQPLPKKETEVHLATVSIKQGQAVFLLSYNDVDIDANDEKKVVDVLDGGVKGSLLNALGKLTKHERIKLGEHPGRHFEYVGNRYEKSLVGSSRIFLVGRRLFQLSVVHAPDVDVSAETAKFFDSFRLVTPDQSAKPVDAFSTDENPASPAPPKEKPKSDGGK